MMRVCLRIRLYCLRHSGSLNGIKEGIHAGNDALTYFTISSGFMREVTASCTWLIGEVLLFGVAIVGLLELLDAAGVVYRLRCWSELTTRDLV